MSWQREVVATPESLADVLATLEPPDRAGERAQFEEACKVVEALAPTVSKRGSMLVTMTGHTDPDAEGFDARNASISVSRIEPDADIDDELRFHLESRVSEYITEGYHPDEARRRAEQTKREAQEAREAEEAATKRREEADVAAKRAEEEASGEAS